MTDWVCNFWKPNVCGQMLLTLDQHKAQKTPSVLSKLNDECNTATVLIPAGCTSLVQPLDVVFNGSFKKALTILPLLTWKGISVIMYMKFYSQWSSNFAN